MLTSVSKDISDADFDTQFIELYGDDKENKPNDFCYWNIFKKCWEETGEHYVDRMLPAQK